MLGRSDDRALNLGLAEIVRKRANHIRHSESGIVDFFKNRPPLKKLRLTGNHYSAVAKNVCLAGGLLASLLTGRLRNAAAASHTGLGGCDSLAQAR